MSYSVIILDIDGTAVSSDYKVSRRLRNAIRRASEAGAVVSVATGRMMRSARGFAKLLEADGPAICYQGALTFDPATGDVLRHERLDARVATSAVEVLRSLGAHVNLYVDDEVYVEAAAPWAEAYAQRMGIELRVVPDLAAVASKEPTLVLGVDEERGADHLVSHLADVLDGSARITHSLRHFCEVGSLRAGKEQALEHLADMLGVGREQFIAFGDGVGDAGMLRWAGLGVAMESGHADALAAADLTAPPPQEDGVAQVLERLLDEGRIGR